MASKYDENTVPRARRYFNSSDASPSTSIQNTGYPTGIPAVRVPKSFATKEESIRGFDFIHESETKGE